METQGITNLPEISVAEDAPEWADDLQFVKLADAASFEATFQISEETIKALDEAMKNIARQITAAMAAASDICQAVAAVFREYEESTAPVEELFAEFEEIAKLAEVLNPEQLAARRSLYSAKTRHRAAAVARTGIIRATSRRFDGQTLYLKQAKISKKLPRSDMTFHPALAGCAGTKQHRPSADGRISSQIKTARCRGTSGRGSIPQGLPVRFRGQRFKMRL